MRNIGRQAARVLAAHYQTMERVMQADQADLENLPDIAASALRLWQIFSSSRKPSN